MKTLDQRALDLHRLAQQAQDRKMKIYVIPARDAWFATSHSKPHILHEVSLESCDCAGFLRHGVRTPMASLNDFLGKLPPIAVE